jgi:flagellum-specific ATP synthase
MSLSMAPYRTRLDELHLMPCRGRVVRLTGLTVESQGPTVGVGELCDIHLADGRVITAEVIGFHDERRVLMPLETIEGIAPQDVVIARQFPPSVPLSDALLGRVLDGMGQPIDGQGLLPPGQRRSLVGQITPPLVRERITQPLGLGIRAIDGLSTCGKGQRLGIFAGSGVGKSTLLGEIARSTEADVNVLALVGERGREVREFIEECLGPDGLARSVVCVATSDTGPIQRVKVPFLALTIAEYFRDQGRDVLVMMDSLTRFAHAQREIGLAAGEPPTTKGYCPSVFSLLPKITERMGSSPRGSITGILTVLVDGDDMTDPVADAVRSLLDGHIVLNRRLAEHGHYPAIDPLSSVSRLMNAVTAPEHQQAARKLRAIWSTYRDAEDLINIGAYVQGSNPRIDLAVELIEPVRQFLMQATGEEALDIDAVGQALIELTGQWDFFDAKKKESSPVVAPPQRVPGGAGPATALPDTLMKKGSR